MKLQKYREITQQHPFVIADMQWRGSSINTEEFVRTKLKYIAFQPFKNLDLSSRESRDRNCTVEYTIVFHVKNHDGHYGRARHVTDDFESCIDGTIQAHLTDLKGWFANCPTFADDSIVWERIVKRTTWWGPEGFQSMALNIFLFPSDYV